MKIKHVFWNGFFLGWCAAIIAIALLLAVGGCKMDLPEIRQAPPMTDAAKVAAARQVRAGRDS